MARLRGLKKTGGGVMRYEQLNKKALVGQTKSSVTFLHGDFFEEIEISSRNFF